MFHRAPDVGRSLCLAATPVAAVRVWAKSAGRTRHRRAARPGAGAAEPGRQRATRHAAAAVSQGPCRRAAGSGPHQSRHPHHPRGECRPLLPQPRHRRLCTKGTAVLRVRDERHCALTQAPVDRAHYRLTRIGSRAGSSVQGAGYLRLARRLRSRSVANFDLSDRMRNLSDGSLSRPC
jgi:hypothetical protein